MRVDQRFVFRLRALFGLGFVALGAVMVWRVAIAPAPMNSKVLGGGLGAVMIGLGVTRLVQYLRWQRGADR